MRILNFGECIENGNYLLHSKFNKVYNYSNASGLISIVSDQVGNGPNNIVFNSLPKSANNSLQINDSEIKIGEEIYYQVNPKRSQNYNELFITNPKELLFRISALSDLISEKFASKSLAFLLFPDKRSDFQTSFEKAFRDHALQAVSNFSLETLPEVVKKMKGIGFGLTPSGDDFNCGILYAVNYLIKTEFIIDSEILDNCYQNSLGKNLISNTFLKYAYLNKYYENFYNLLKAIKQNHKDEILHYANKMISLGHTSGADMLAGFILTIKGVLNDKKFG